MERMDKLEFRRVREVKADTLCLYFDYVLMISSKLSALTPFTPLYQPQCSILYTSVFRISDPFADELPTPFDWASAIRISLIRLKTFIGG